MVSFVRFHPLMHGSVLPLNGRPVFQLVRAEYTLTQIVVDRVSAEDGQYEVMFLGTGEAHVNAMSRNRTHMHTHAYAHARARTSAHIRPHKYTHTQTHTSLSFPHTDTHLSPNTVAILMNM